MCGQNWMSWCHFTSSPPRAALKFSFEWWNFTSGPSRSTATSTITDCGRELPVGLVQVGGRAEPAQAGLVGRVAGVEVEDDVRLGERPALVQELVGDGTQAGEPVVVDEAGEREPALLDVLRPLGRGQDPEACIAGVAHGPRGYGPDATWAEASRTLGVRIPGGDVDRQISRRDLMRWSLLAGATIPAASILAACGGSDGPRRSGPDHRDDGGSHR